MEEEKNVKIKKINSVILKKKVLKLTKKKVNIKISTKYNQPNSINNNKRRSRRRGRK